MLPTMFTHIISLSIVCYLVHIVLTASPITRTNDFATLSDEATALLMLADNDTLTPPVAINSSNILGINSEISTSLNLSAAPVHCFSPDQPQGRVIYNDYLLALEKIAVMRDAMQSRSWDLGPKGRKWVSGRTAIGLRGPISRSPFVFQMIYVAHLAAMVAQECVTQEKSFMGGLVRFGYNNDFAVLVAARPSAGGTAVGAS